MKGLWEKGGPHGYQPPFYHSLTSTKTPTISHSRSPNSAGPRQMAFPGPVLTPPLMREAGRSLPFPLPHCDCHGYYRKRKPGTPQMLTYERLSLRSRAASTPIICHWLKESQLGTAEESNWLAWGQSNHHAGIKCNLMLAKPWAFGNAHRMIYLNNYYEWNIILYYINMNESRSSTSGGLFLVEKTGKFRAKRWGKKFA